MRRLALLFVLLAANATAQPLPYCDDAALAGDKNKNCILRHWPSTWGLSIVPKGPGLPTKCTGWCEENPSVGDSAVEVKKP